jgi:photosystem II stability/assembly factor-like uncharacterized protein
MSVVTPRPPRSDDRPDVEALEALIKEARRRARRRRFAVCALVAAAAGLLGFYGFNHGGGATRPDRAQQPNGEAGIAPEVAYGRWRWAPGLEGGAITALALDSQHPNTVFAATLEAGVFKSSDSGRSWRPLDIAPSTQRVDALAIAPQDPQTVYAGTGEGAFKSTDGGTTWQAVNSGLVGKETAQEREHRRLEGYVYELVLDPRDPDVVYAATWERGLLKTSDGGSSWRSVGLKAVYSVVVDPANPEIVYAGAAGVALGGASANSGVFRSSDGGASWQPVGLQGTNVDALALDSQHRDTVYAGTNGKGVFKSTDGGASWHAAGLEGMDVRGLILNPKNPENVYAESNGRIFASTDGGGTWRALNAGWVPGTWPTALALNPRNPATLYLGTITAVDGKGDVGAGVFKSVDGGHSWRSMNAGLTDARVSALALDPRDPGTAYAGIDGRGVFKRADGMWRAANTGLTSEGVHAIAVDPRHPANVYAGTDAGVFKSDDRGASWRRLDTPIRSHEAISALVIDPQAPHTVYAITSDDSTQYRNGVATFYKSRVLKSTDGGLTWPIGTYVQRLRAPAKGGEVLAQKVVGPSPLVIDPWASGTLYAGGLGVSKSVDGGRTWRRAGLKGNSVLSLAVDPDVPATVYAGTNQGLLKSTDAGANWQAVHGRLDGVRVEAIAIDPKHRRTVYAGTDRGVFWTANGGDRWRRFTGLPLRDFDALAIVGPHRVYAGAYGGGIFELRRTR